MYELIKFPEVQVYMDEPDFQENAHVCVDIGGAFFVDVEWLGKKVKTFTIREDLENIPKGQYILLWEKWEGHVPNTQTPFVGYKDSEEDKIFMYPASPLEEDATLLGWAQIPNVDFKKNEN